VLRSRSSTVRGAASRPRGDTCSRARAGHGGIGYHLCSGALPPQLRSSLITGRARSQPDHRSFADPARSPVVRGPSPIRSCAEPA
jgi:hypothetical protein